MPKVADDAAPETITVVLADDHEIVRDGIRMVLEAEADVEVVAEAGDADSAARYVLGHKPTVLVLDLSMPGTPSLEILPKIAATSPDTAVVVLTMQNEPAFAREALRKGVRGYVIKHSAASELVGAVRSAVAGETYINPQLGARMVAEADLGPPDDLTPDRGPRAGGARLYEPRDRRAARAQRPHRRDASRQHSAQDWPDNACRARRVRARPRPGRALAASPTPRA